MDFESLKSNAMNFLDENGWIIQVFTIVFVTLLISMVLRWIVNRLIAKIEHTENIFDDAVLKALGGPMSGLIWIIGISVAAEMVGQRTDAVIFDFVEPVRNVGVIAMLAWYLIKFIQEFQAQHVEKRLAAGEEVDRTFVDATGKLLRASVVITAALIMLQTLGFSVSGVLAFGGVGGIAVGFAARDIMANLFGGLTIYLDRPFAVGDWIRSPDKEIEGTVEEIGWRRTVIRTFETRPLYVPNATFTTISVENPSRMANRRIKETIGVRYDDVRVLPDILEQIRRLLQEHPDIDQSRTLMVNLNEFGDSSVNFFIYTFTRTTVWTEYHEIKERIMLEISRIIETNGAEIAYPTTTVHVPDEVHLSGAQAMASEQQQAESKAR